MVFHYVSLKSLKPESETKNLGNNNRNKTNHSSYLLLVGDALFLGHCIDSAADVTTETSPPLDVGAASGEGEKRLLEPDGEKRAEGPAPPVPGGETREEDPPWGSLEEAA